MVSIRGLDVATRRPALSAPPAGEGRLRPVERLLLGYVAVTSALAATRLARFPQCGWLILANGLIAALVWLVSRRSPGRAAAALREIYPLLLLLPLYGGLDILNGGGRVPVHDAMIQRWEAWLFGGQPSRDWWRAAPSPVWSVILHGAYFGYYLIIALPPLALIARRDVPGLRRLLFAIIAAFVPCYLCFAFFPVAGPYYAFPRPEGDFVHNPMARLVYATLATGSSYGAAFPSSHVAVSAAATWACWRAWRPLGGALLVATALLTVSVVYCQMHYAVDALAGLVVGLVVGAAATRKSVSRKR